MVGNPRPAIIDSTIGSDYLFNICYIYYNNMTWACKDRPFSVLYLGQLHIPVCHYSISISTMLYYKLSWLNRLFIFWKHISSSDFTHYVAMSEFRSSLVMLVFSTMIPFKTWKLADCNISSHYRSNTINNRHLPGLIMWRSSCLHQSDL